VKNGYFPNLHHIALMFVIAIGLLPFYRKYLLETELLEIVFEDVQEIVVFLEKTCFLP